MRTEQGRLTLRAIEIFVAVVEEGSLAAGAKRLGASPSSVSQQISNLEAALGARVIDRTARPFALTPAGYVFQRRALAILDEAARAQSELSELELTGLPQLRLATIEEFDVEITPSWVAQLAGSLPGCTISTHAGPSHQNLAALESRAVDLVVAADMDAPPDWIERHAILREPYVLVTVKGLLGGRDEALAALMTRPMIHLSGELLMGRQIATHLRRLRLSPPRIYEFDSNHSMMAMTAKTGGWTISTPLGYLRSARFHDILELHPLPFKSFARTLTLYARRDVLGGLPSRAAEGLRGVLAATAVPEIRSLAPWLTPDFRILGGGSGDDPPGLYAVG